MTAAAPLPLAGTRVVELTHMVMGPTCGMILGDLGAVLQRRQGVLQRRPRGVVRTTVLIALVITGRGLHVGAGLVDGRHDGPRGGVRFHAGVDGLGAEFHAV
jgi:hypothetical protein